MRRRSRVGGLWLSCDSRIAHRDIHLTLSLINMPEAYIASGSLPSNLAIILSEDDKFESKKLLAVRRYH